DQNCPVPVTATPTPNTGATQTAISATQTAAAGSATATATTTACTVTTQGSITISDPLQAGRLITLVSASSCGTTRNCPGTFDTLNRHYKSYTYQNGGSTPACVTVNLTPACAGGLLIQSAAYLGSFDPSNLCANYLGDIGPIPNLLGGSYSFTVPAGATYVVVVNELVPGLGCSGFTLSVTSDQNCPVPGTATPTPGGGTQTAIAGTATAAASETSVSGTATAAASETSVSGTATAAASETSISATQTAAASQTSVSATLTAAASRTAGAGTPTPTANGATQTAISATQTAISNCTINFSDVHQTDYFYTPVLYLFCHGVISGYSDGTFRPYNNTTRSQMVKIVVLGFNKAITTPAGGSYTFTDVPRSNNFFSLIETAAALNIVSGYNCGTAPAGPCDAQNRPWFLPYNNVTRGQLSKIDVIAAGWTQINPAMGHFSDVPHGYVFYTVIETAYCHGALGGYSDGTFRPSNNATRGQIAKIVYLSIVNPPTNCSGGAAAP
ncbi:MAG: S-layer homology domain-containing protein, partial [Chloroflexia bacterium]